MKSPSARSLCLGLGVPNRGGGWGRALTIGRFVHPCFPDSCLLTPKDKNAITAAKIMVHEPMTTLLLQPSCSRWEIVGR